MRVSHKNKQNKQNDNNNIQTKHECDQGMPITDHRQIRDAQRKRYKDTETRTE